MADQHIEYRNSQPRSSGSGALAFVVGGLVVLVGIIAYVIFGTDADFSTNSSAPASIEVNTSADSAAGAEAADDAADSAAAAESDGGSADAAAGATASGN